MLVGTDVLVHETLPSKHLQYKILYHYNYFYFQKPVRTWREAI